MKKKNLNKFQRSALENNITSFYRQALIKIWQLMVRGLHPFVRGLHRLVRVKNWPAEANQTRQIRVAVYHSYTRFLARIAPYYQLFFDYNSHISQGLKKISNLHYIIRGQKSRKSALKYRHNFCANSAFWVVVVKCTRH